MKLALIGLSLLDSDRKELALLIEVVKTVKVSGKDRVVSITGRVSSDVITDALKKDE